MAKEIERKFLVRSDGWRSAVETKSVFRQGYIASMDDRSVRVRILDGRKAKLTIKIGRSTITRDEFEYDIRSPMPKSCCRTRSASSSRRRAIRVPHEDFVWEVDVFTGEHRGLVIAEVEMTAETDDPPLPTWLGREVTGDFRYSNQALATEYGHDGHGLSHSA